jgi:hypothetical protein
VLHGIYRGTRFARFWSAEIDTAAQRIQRLSKDQLDGIQEAVSARRIMNRDTQEFDNGWITGQPLPFMIWWPLGPSGAVLYHLDSIAPDTHEAIAMAVIIWNYHGLYECVTPKPTYHIWRAAKSR